MVEAPLPLKKKKVGPKKRMVYKNPQAQEFLTDLRATCTVGVVLDLLTAGMEFHE